MTGDMCDNIALVLCPRSFSTPPAVTMLTMMTLTILRITISEMSGWTVRK